MFEPFPKIARLSRDIVITEKLDGTNGQIVIMTTDEYFGMVERVAPIAIVATSDFVVLAGSRNRWINLEQDNYGLAKWVRDNAEELVDALGPGRHYGEWWGRGIQRNYSQTERRFSLFNTKRWGTHYDNRGRVGPCFVVPTLYAGPMEERGVMKGLQQSINCLKINGSIAAPGFMRPEGVVIYHTASGSIFKKTLEGDDAPKGGNKSDAWPGATETAVGGR